MHFYTRWIWANGWSELVGLGGTLAVGWLVFGQTDDAGAAQVILSAAVMVVVATMLEGAVVGLAQAAVLSSARPEIKRRSWIVATMIGAGTAWVLGMIPSTIAALTAASEETAAVQEPGGATMILLAAGMGLVLGPILATPQYFVLRRVVSGAMVWIPANALAWSIGMVAVFLGAGSIPPDASWIRVGVTVVVACLGAGVLVGAVHGRFLLLLIRHSGAA